MPTDTPTESGSSETEPTSGESPFLKHTDVQAGRAEAYSLSSVPSSTSPAQFASTRPRSQDGEAPRARAEASSPAERYALCRLVARCVEQARRMEGAVHAAEPMDLATAAYEFKASLSEMWQARRVRGEAWAAAVNFVQAALAAIEFEQLDGPNCAALRTVTEEFLTRGALNDDDVERIIDLLSGGGLDPWFGVSRTPEDADEG